MAIKLGEIFISLGLSTASFTKNLDDAKKRTLGSSKELERAFGVIGKAVAGMAVSAATGLAFLTRQAINNAEQMGALAQKAGVGVAALSGLTHAAEQSEVSQDQLVLGLTKLSKTMAEASRGSRVLGVSFRDQQGNLRMTDDVLLDLAERFQMMPDGARKTALAMQLFGKSGADLIPFLNQGRKGITELIAEAERLGLIISTRMARQADQFNDALSNIGKAARGVANGIAIELLPTLNRFMEGAARASRTSGLSAAQIGQGLVRGVQLAKDPLEQLTVLWAVLRAQVFKTTKAHEELERVMLRVLTGFKTPKNLEELFGGPPGMGIAQRLDWLGPGRRPGDPALEEDEKRRQKLQDFIKGLKEQADTFGKNIVFINAYKSAQMKANEVELQAVHALSQKLFFLQAIADMLKSVARVPKFEMPVGAEALSEVIEEMALEMGDFAKNTQGAAGILAGLGVVGPNVLRPIADEITNLKNAMPGFTEQSLRMFGDWIIFGGSFRGVLQGILQDLARMVFQLLVIEPLMKSIFGAKSGGGGGGGGGGGIFGFLSSLFGGLFGGGGGINIGASNFPGVPTVEPFAHGGPVWPGQSFLVGERGPELFSPKFHGDIIPNHALRAGGGVVNHFNIDNRGADLGTTAKTAAMLDRWALKHFAQLMHDRQTRTA